MECGHRQDLDAVGRLLPTVATIDDESPCDAWQIGDGA
jgi:hypothetical protein